MILRKINALISLLTTVILLNHAVFHAIWMLSGGKVAIDDKFMPWVMFVAMMIHAVLSIILAVLGHKGAEKRKCNGYPNLNRSTYIQRASGMALIVLTLLHVLGTVGILQPPEAVHAILPPLFFAVTLMHAAISTGKAFITLGIGNAKFFKISDIVIKVMCGIILIADVIGFFMYIS